MSKLVQATSGLGTAQLQLIERCKRFIAARERDGADVAVDPECYLSGWSDVRGNARLRSLAGSVGAIGKMAVARLKDALNVARHSGYELLGAAAVTHDHDRLVVSWCRASDFAEDGSYRDRYFQASSRETATTFWLLISIDQQRPQRIDPNVGVFCRSPRVPRFDVFYLLRAALTAARDTLLGRARRRGLSATVELAEAIAVQVSRLLEAGSFRCLIVPYEAQPFQHAIMRAAQKLKPQMVTVGYLHSALPPLPTDLIRRAGAPQLLLVHGRGQVDILVRHLNWPLDALRSIRSLRYRASGTAGLGGQIFLPYSFANAGVVASAFRRFVSRAAPGSLPALSVRNHPVMQDSPRHLRLQQTLDAIMREQADRFSPQLTRSLSVFVGATAAIVEALESHVIVIHICSQPLLEAHSREVWDRLLVERLDDNVFRYELPVTGEYIEFGSAETHFERCIDQQLAAA